MLIVIGYVIVAGLFAALTPAWQSPDEPAHYNNVRHIAQKGGCCPVIEPGDWQNAYQDELKAARFKPDLLGRLDTIQYEDHQPPLYYLLARVWTPFPAQDKLVQMRLFSVLIGAGVVLCAYGIGRALLPERPQVALAMAALVAFLPQHVHMLASVNNDGLAEFIIGLTLLATIYYLQDRRSLVLYPILAAALMLAILAAVAILGDLLFDPARASTTSMNLLAMVAAVGMLAVAVRYGYVWLKFPNRRRMAVQPWMLGLLVGLGLVTKVSTLLLIGVVPLAIFLKWRMGRVGARYIVSLPPQVTRQAAVTLWRYRDTALGRVGASIVKRAVPNLLKRRLQPFAPLLRDLAGFALPVIVLAGLWALRNISVYDFPDVFGLRAHDAVVAGQLRTADLIAQIGAGEYLSRAVQTTFNSFWGQFGWMAAPMPTWAYIFVLALLALAAAGWVLQIRRVDPTPHPLPRQQGGGEKSLPRRRGRLGGGQTSAYLILAFTALLAVLAYLYYNTVFVQFQGRYLYPGLIPFALALALGVDAVRGFVFSRNRRGEPSVRPYTASLTILPFLLFAPLDVYLLFRFIIPALSP
ncbi:MAG: hypothetical protein HZC41_22215 [Chloroflexi bacterium]|nr:hypothetical protein [Chloroflexota bacterium]